MAVWLAPRHIVSRQHRRAARLVFDEDRLAEPVTDRLLHDAGRDIDIAAGLIRNDEADRLRRKLLGLRHRGEQGRKRHATQSEIAVHPKLPPLARVPSSMQRVGGGRNVFSLMCCSANDNRAIWRNDSAPPAPRRLRKGMTCVQFICSEVSRWPTTTTSSRRSPTRSETTSRACPMVRPASGPAGCGGCAKFSSSIHSSNPPAPRSKTHATGYTFGQFRPKARRRSRNDGVSRDRLCALRPRSSYRGIRQAESGWPLSPGTRFQVCFPTPIGLLWSYVAPEYQRRLERAMIDRFLAEAGRYARGYSASRIGDPVGHAARPPDPGGRARHGARHRPRRPGTALGGVSPNTFHRPSIWVSTSATATAIRRTRSNPATPA